MKKCRSLSVLLLGSNQRNRRTFRLALASAAILALSTACSTVGTEGPLFAGEGDSEICTPAVSEGFVAVGDIVSNEGDRELTITGIELVDSTDLTLQGSYLMTINGVADYEAGAVLGTASTVSNDPQQIAAWDRRSELENFTLGPREKANLVVTLSLPTAGTDGKAEAMRISYSDGRRNFTADTALRIILASEAACF